MSPDGPPGHASRVGTHPAIRTRETIVSIQAKTASTATDSALTTKNRVGLGLAALLGLNGTLVSPFVLAGSDDGPNSSGPPLPVILVGVVLGLITLLAVVYTWRTGNRGGARVIAAARIIAALLAVPAFFVSNVAPGLVVLASSVMVVTVVTIVLVLSRPPAGLPND
jgi:hypothetical protein